MTDQTTPSTGTPDHVTVTNAVIEHLEAHPQIRFIHTNGNEGSVPRYIADEIGQAVLALTPATASLVSVITVAPEVIERLERIASAFEAIAAAILPDADAVEARYCSEPIWPRDVDGTFLPVDAPGVPLVCTRFAGHEPGHVARDEDGVMIACETCAGGHLEAAAMVCRTCHTDYSAKSS